jgi:hypothetical protein
MRESVWNDAARPQQAEPKSASRVAQMATTGRVYPRTVPVLGLRLRGSSPLNPAASGVPAPVPGMAAGKSPITCGASH